MSRNTMRRMALVAGAAWLVIAGSELIRGLVEYGDNWEAPYIVFMVALVVGATLAIAIGAEATIASPRPRLRMVGLAVSALGAVACLVGAWALPLWMTILGGGFALLAVAAGPAQRRPLALLAAGQFVGIAALIVGIEAQVGRVDEYGDYPLAGGIAILFAAITAIVALLTLAFDRRAVAATPAAV
jgi:hypothetical protein